MSEKDGFDKAKVGAEVLKTVLSAAGESEDVKQAGANLAKSAKAVTALVDNCLLPIAAVNFAFEKGREYFTNKFSNDLAEATASIPVDALIEPKASVAAPALEGLGFSHEEEELKRLYLNLIASAMDGRFPEKAHPSFAEIIRQLSAVEARLLSGVFKAQAKILPLVRLDQKSTDINGQTVRFVHVANFKGNDGNPVESVLLPSMIENWKRLGLIEIDYSRNLAAETAYEWVERRPEFRRLTAELGRERVSISKGIMLVTPFGKMFSSVVTG